MIESLTIAQPIAITRKPGVTQGVVIILLSLLPMLIVAALVPAVPAIVEHFKDVPNIMTLAPMVLAAPGLCVALFSPFAGYLADRLGRRQLLLIFTLLYGIGGVLPYFIQSFPILICGRLLQGIGGAFIFTIGNTLLGDYFEPKEAAKWLTIQSITGTVFGTSLLSFSGYLTSIGWQYPFLIYGLTFIISMGAFFFIFEPNVKTERSKLTAVDSSEKLPVGLIVTLCIITLVAAIVYFVYTFHFSLALDSLGIKDRIKIGNYSAIAGIGTPVGAFLFKVFSKKTIHQQFVLMAFLFGIGLLGIGLAPNISVVILAAFVSQLGTGMTIPVLISWSLQRLPSTFRGRGMGFWSSAFFLGQFVSPLVVSGVRSLTGGLLNAFIAFGIFCLFLAILNLFFIKRK